MGRIKIKKQNYKGKREVIWIWLAAISMTIYILWRGFCTIPNHAVYGWLAAICGIILLSAEAISMLEGIGHFFSSRKKSVPDKPVIPIGWYPHIDVFIATHNEDVELLYKTVNGCRHMRYTDQNKIHIYLCDDGNRPAVAGLAERMGVGYLGLPENKHAKAGNLNNALSKTSSPYIVTFDADMIPTREFLMETVPYMFLPRLKQSDNGLWAERDEDEIDETFKMGFIQTPQSFYNPDLFQFNFFSENRIPNEQDFFFREVNVGRNNSNACIYAGSNTLISREALEAAGGISTGTITEDFETGIKIQAKGYTCYALDKVLAHGLAPTDIDNLLKQRVRWGRGCIASLRRVNLLFNKGIPIGGKLNYLACWTYWWTFLRRFIYIVAPILFVAFDIPVVVCGLREILFIWLPSYLLYNHVLKVASGGIRSQRWSNIVDTTIFPYMILPMLMETLLLKETEFHVTDKSRTVEKKSDLQFAIPHLFLLVVDLYALMVAVATALRDQNLGAVILIYWLAVNGLNLVMAIFFMAGRKNMRTNDRFFVKIPVKVTYKDKKYYGVTQDLSESGLSFLSGKAIYAPDGVGEVAVHLKADGYETTVKGHAVHVVKQENGWKYGIQLDELSGREKDTYYQILYDRDHGLAKKMSKSVSIFDDVFLNIHKRTERSTESRRRLPRVAIDRVFPLTEEGHVRMVDCNYEFVILSGEEGCGLRQKLKIVLPNGIMCCSKAGQKEGLYHVDNMEELLFCGAYDELFASV